MATRSRTQIFLRYRDTLRTHKRGPRTSTELREFKVHKNLLAAQSDDEGSTVDARVYSVPPVWVTMVDDMNRDIAQIKIKSAHTRHPERHDRIISLLIFVLVQLFLRDDAMPCLYRISVSELQTLSGKALLPGFADDDDQEEVIASTVQDVSALFKECEKRLKEMSRTKSEGSGDEVCSAQQ